MNTVALRSFPLSRSTIFAGLLSTVVLGGAAQAQGPTEADIVNALTPKPVMRSLSIGAAPARASTSDDTAFIESIQSRPSRSLSSDDRAKIAVIASAKPSIDLEIPFDYNSAKIGVRTEPAVRRLGAALARPELNGGTFLIGGHTDGRGSDQYNQGLSERRAEAVKRFIVQNYKLPPKALISLGYGKSRMKNAKDPMAEENRRVEVTNVANAKSAAR